MTRLGQDLFFPPNVGGWPGGRAWLSGRAVVGRANFAAALADGKLNADGRVPDLAGLAERLAPGAEAAASLVPLGRLLTGRPLDPSAAAALWQATAVPSADHRINHAVALLLAQPASQLC